jgi:hypothetical protein
MGRKCKTEGLEICISIYLSDKRLIGKYTTSLSFRQGEFGQLFKLLKLLSNFVIQGLCEWF